MSGYFGLFNLFFRLIVVFLEFQEAESLPFFMLQNNDGSQKISGDSLKNVYKSFVTDYPIVSIEDPFDQDDWEHYAKMTSEIGEHVQIVGDDLLVTNPKVKFTDHLVVLYFEMVKVIRLSLGKFCLPYCMFLKELIWFIVLGCFSV